MLQFVKRLLNPVDIDFGDVQVGLLSFSTRPTIEFQLNTYKTKQDIFSAIDGVPWRYGSTNTADALQEMHETMFSRENGDRRDAGNVCIILTDGVSNINYRRTVPEAKTAREKGILIISIGIGLQDLREIRGIASEPSEVFVFHAETFAELLYLRMELPMGRSALHFLPYDIPKMNSQIFLKTGILSYLCKETFICIQNYISL